MDKQKKNLGVAAFLPLIVFLACYVGCGITFSRGPFGRLCSSIVVEQKNECGR